MKHLGKHSNLAMTRMEALIAIVILMIFLALLLPGVVSIRPDERRENWKMDMQSLSSAIKQYESAYGRMPVVKGCGKESRQDFTFGTAGTQTKVQITNAFGLQANNSEIMAILMDWTAFPDGQPTANVDHSLNPRKQEYLSFTLQKDNQSPGIGPDGVFRDPWGNPYIITLDLNGDGRCRDAFYCRTSVSQAADGTNGLYGLTRAVPKPGDGLERDSFEFKGSVMIWSLGPDGKADPTQKANEGVNKDNVLGWVY